MSSRTHGKGVKLKPKPKQEVEETAPVVPPRDIYQSVVRDFGFDPLKEKAARST